MNPKVSWQLRLKKAGSYLSRRDLAGLATEIQQFLAWIRSGRPGAVEKPPPELEDKATPSDQCDIDSTRKASSGIALEQYMKETVEWLDGRFAFRPGILYTPHQAVYGFLPQYLAYFKFAYALMQRVQKLSFSSFLDVGSAEGYFPNLVKQMYGERLQVAHLDISASAIHTARQFYQLTNGLVADIGQLPFADRSIDLVFCVDVIEHVPDPKRAVREMERIAAKYLIVSTWACPSEAEKQRFAPDFSYPHTHLHYFTEADIHDMMGEGIMLERFHSTLLSMVIGQHQMEGSAKVWAEIRKLMPTLLKELHGDTREMYCDLLKHLVRQLMLSVVATVSPAKEAWTRRRLVDVLRTDEQLSTRYPMHTYSFLAIKDRSGGLPAPITSRAMDHELLEVMWARSGVDRARFGHDGQGRIYLRPEAVDQ